MKLFVGNLSARLTDAELRSAFSVYGEVRRARIVFDRDTGRSRGYGFVDMDDDAALRAAEGMHRIELDGCRLNVAPASGD